MKTSIAFTEGVGTGAGIILIFGMLLLLTRTRAVTAAARRIDDAVRAGRSPLTGQPPPNYLDLCRAAGL